MAIGASEIWESSWYASILWRPKSSPSQPIISTCAMRQESSIGRDEPTTIQWSSDSIRGQSGADPLMSSTRMREFMAPSTAVPHDSPSP